MAGQADGIQPRTIEMMQVRWFSAIKPEDVDSPRASQSYGLAEPLLKHGNQMHMVSSARYATYRSSMSCRPHSTTLRRKVA